MVIMLYFCYARLNGKMDLPSMSETSCNFCYLSLLNTSLKVVSKIVENQFLKSCFELSSAILIQNAQQYFRNILDQYIGKELEKLLQVASFPFLCVTVG